MKSLRGLAALGVILHHISQEDIFQSRHVLPMFVNAGAHFVARFFFCSGYGLIKSLDTKKDYLKGFIRNRVIKTIVLPFYVNVLIYGLLIFISGTKLPKERWIFNFLGLTMMNTYAWFPIVLAFLYLAFYLCFRFIKKLPVCLAVILAVIFATVIAGVGEQKLTELIQKLLFRKKKENGLPDDLKDAVKEKTSGLCLFALKRQLDQFPEVFECQGSDPGYRR